MQNVLITVSKRAQGFRLKISAEKGLEIIGPRTPNEKMVANMLSTHAAWIKKHLMRIEQAQQHRIDPASVPLPETLTLAAAQETWRLVEKEPQGVASVREKEGVLFITPDKEGVWHKALSAWVNRRTPTYLTPLLEEASKETGLVFKRVQYRNQKSRWGSCSTTGTISLNRSLIWLPESIARYVMVHELCHTIHMDHSRAFWGLVSKHDAFYRAHDAELKDAKRYVPAWYIA